MRRSFPPLLGGRSGRERYLRLRTERSTTGGGLICASREPKAFLRILVLSINAVFHPSATCSTSRALACAILPSAKDLTTSTYAFSATSDERANNRTLSSTSRPMSVVGLLGGGVVVLVVDFRAAIVILLRIKS